MNYPTISLNEWQQVGAGGNGATYINPAEPDVLLKVSRLGDGTEEAMNKEFHTSQAVQRLGIPTPEMKKLVKVGEDYGIISELIKGKQSLGRLTHEAPERIDELARHMAQMARQLHATAVKDTTYLPSMKALMLEALEQTTMVGGKKLRELKAFVSGLEDAPTLLHGDIQPGNVIMAGGRSYWIDLGRACHGIPMFDLGHFYLFCNIFSKKQRVQDIAHMTDKQMVQFWHTFAGAYHGEADMAAFEAECKRFAALDVVLLGHIQTLNWHERLFLGLLAKALFKE